MNLFSSLNLILKRTLLVEMCFHVIKQVILLLKCSYSHATETRKLWQGFSHVNKAMRILFYYGGILLQNQNNFLLLEFFFLLITTKVRDPNSNYPNRTGFFWSCAKWRASNTHFPDTCGIILHYVEMILFFVKGLRGT